MNTASSVAISLQASNICFAYVELFHTTCHSIPGLEALSLPCPLVLFPLPQLIAQSVTLESYAPLILGNAPCCLVNLWCHQQQPRRRHPKQMGSQASEMKAGRSHTLLTTATLSCGEVEPTRSQLRKSPFAVLLRILAAWRFQAHAEV